MNKNFEVFVPLQKGINPSEDLVGIASTLSVDRDSERMSENALRDMETEILAHGVNLFGNHEHLFENTLGVINKAKIENNQLKIGIRLDDPITNPKIPMLLNKIKRGIKLGLSVGGAVTKEREEYDKKLNKKIKIIDGVKLYEISVVGIPSNTDALLTLPQAISKCFRKKCPSCHEPLNLNNNKCEVCLWKK